MSVAPFPWRALDSVRRTDIELLAKMRRTVSGAIAPISAENALRELLGDGELSIRVRRVTTNPPRVEDSAVAALIARAERADHRRGFVIVLEQSLAVALATRALRRPAPRVLDGTVRATPSLAGAAFAILVAAARRNALAPLRVISAGPAHSILADLVALDANPVGVTFTVLLDHEAYLAHAFAPRSALDGVVARELSTETLAALGAMPIEAPLVAAFLTLTVAELAALDVGDALFPLALTRAANGFRGDLHLAVPESESRFDVTLGDDGRVVLGDGQKEEEPVDKDALSQSIGETPVVVRVEVGTVQMSAREWAAAAPGDVLTLGKRIGEHVVLRAGGVEVARGELVDVEGEIGVRIIARAGGTVA